MLDLKKQMQEKALLLKMMADLVRIHNKFILKVDKLESDISKKVGPKGDKGDTGPRGDNTPIKGRDYFTEQEINSFVKEIEEKIPKPKDGKTPTKQELTDLIRPLIPKLNDEKIAKLVALYAKESETDKTKTIEKILLGRKKPSAQDVEGLDSAIHKIARQYLHGGGDTVVAGTGITIVTNANGTKTISASGSASLPDQSGNSGKFLTTDGSDASWGTPVGYTVVMLTGASTVNIPADGATYYLRHSATFGNSTTAGLSQGQLYFPKAGTITSAMGSIVTTTGGTTEKMSLYLVLNGTTDILVTDALASDATGFNPFSITLSQVVAVGDYVEIKIVCPTWVTNPTGVRLSLTLFVE